MPSHVRGPLDGETSEPIDGGTKARIATPPKGLRNQPAARPAPAVKLVFSRLWQAYPSDPPYKDRQGGIPKGYENQCAIKVSVALHGSGVVLKTFDGATVAVGTQRVAVRAQELAHWLEKSARVEGLPRKPRDITGEKWQQAISGETGIVYFQDYWLREGEKNPSGDHIDLWNGSRLTISGALGAVVAVARFGLNIQTGPGFSDLGKSRRILFWSVK